MILRRGLFIVTVFSLIALASPVRSQENPYEINVILPLTGPGAFIGQTHQKELRAVESVVNKAGGINGRPIRFVFFDDQTNPQVSVQLSNALIAKKVPIVMGSLLSAMCKAMMPLFANGPVQYCLSPAIYPPKGSYTFSSSISTQDLLVATLRFFKAKGWKRVASLNSTDASGQDGDAALADALKLPENRDVTLVDAEHFNPSDVNVSAQLAKIKAANPQVLIVWVPGTPFATALRGLQGAGLDVPIIASSANMVTSQLKEYVGFMPKQLFFPGLSYAANVARSPRVGQAQRIWLNAIKAEGMTPDLQSGLSWDPAMIVVDALRHVGTNATPQQIRNYIENLHDFAGITGIYDFRVGNQRGIGVDDVVMIRWNPSTGAWIAASKPGGTVR